MAYLEDLGCLGTALVELLGGGVDFTVMDGFEVVLVDECTLVLENVNGLGGGGGGGGRSVERTDLFKQILCSDVKLKNVFSCLGNFSIHTRFQV